MGFWHGDGLLTYKMLSEEFVLVATNKRKKIAIYRHEERKVFIFVNLISLIYNICDMDLYSEKVRDEIRSAGYIFCLK